MTLAAGALVDGAAAGTAMTAGVIAGSLLKIPVIVKITASNDYGEVKELHRLPFFKFRRWLLKKVKVFLAVNRDVIALHLGASIDVAIATDYRRPSSTLRHARSPLPR